MNRQDCLILKTLFIERNIKRTADRLFLTQPAVSYRIRKMEKDFDVSIIVRGNRGVHFTREGELLVERAKIIADEIDKTFELVDAEFGSGGIVRIGVANSFAIYRLPSIITSFKEIWPHTKVVVKTGLGSDVMELLQNEEIHLGVESGSYRWEGEAVLLSEDTHTIISNKQLDLTDLPNRPMIAYDVNAEIKKQHNDWWQTHYSEQPTIQIETDFVENAKMIVKQGFGYAIIPSFCVEEDKDLWKSPLMDQYGQPYKMRTWLKYKKSVCNIPSVHRFVEFLTQYFKVNE